MFKILVIRFRNFTSFQRQMGNGKEREQSREIVQIDAEGMGRIWTIFGKKSFPKYSVHTYPRENRPWLE